MKFQQYLIEMINFDHSIITPYLNDIKKLFRKFNSLNNLNNISPINMDEEKLYIKYIEDIGKYRHSSGKKASFVGIEGSSKLKNSNTIEIECSKNIFNTFMNKDRLNIFIDVLDEIISHEIVHIIQTKRSNNKAKYNTLDDTLIDQLNNKHEIMAYAKDTAIEFYNLHYTKNQAYNVLKNIKNINLDNSNIPQSLRSYILTIDKNSLAFKKYIKYVYQYLDGENKLK